MRAISDFKTLFKANIFKALFAVLIVQLSYWVLVNPYLFQPQPKPDSLPVINAAVADLPTPDFALLATADYKPVRLPWNGCCDTGYRAVRIDFILRDVPQSGLGLVSRLEAGNYRLYVNNSLFVGDGEMVLPGISYHGAVRATFRIPPALLKQGANRLDYILVRDAGTPVFAMNAPVLGDYDTIKRAYSWRQFSFQTLRAMSQAIGFAAALLAFVLWLRSKRDPAIFWMAVLCLAWALRLQHHRLTYGFVQGEFRSMLFYLYVILVPVALLNFANHWTDRPSRWLSRLSLAGFGLTLTATTLILGFGLFRQAETAETISMAFLLMIALATLGLFAAQYARTQEHRHWEVAAFVLCATLVAHDSITYLFALVSGEHMQRALGVLLLGFLAPFFAGNVRLFRSMSDLNQLLQSQLAERTAELEAAHAREKDLVRLQAHQSERQRIMRDMHDGLGSQLMSMLLAARRGVAKPASVADGLQSVIDEMRLLIDSMDSVGESLGSAFAMFRERVKGRVEEAGMSFTWNDQSDGKVPHLGPRDILQIFRVMQEAVTNALKHSNGTAIDVTLSHSPHLNRSLRIAIADNGTGLCKANPRGKGLDSMAARAEAIGGIIDVQSSQQGAIVTLDLP